MLWEEVLRRLPAAMQALERPTPGCALAAMELLDAVDNLLELVSDCMEQAQQPSQTEQDALRRAAMRLGELLTAHAGSLFGDGVVDPQQLHPWRLTIMRFFTVLASSCVMLLQWAPSSDLEQFCIQLLPLFNSSSAALSVAVSELSQSQLETAQSLAEAQLDLLSSLCFQRPPQDPVLTCLAAKWPPDALATWLAGALAFMARTRTGCPAPSLQFSFACVAATVCGSPAFISHRPALQRHPQLCRGLVAALLPMVRAVAVTARLPPERQQQAAFSWLLVGALSMALFSDTLRPALHAWVAAAGTPSLAAHMGSLVQLAEALESGGGCSDDPARSLLDTAQLLASTVGLLSVLVEGLVAPGRAQGGASQPAVSRLASQQRWQLAALPLPALRHLGAHLRLALEACREAGFALHFMCASWRRLFAWLPVLVPEWQSAEPPPTQPPAGRDADLAAWCTAIADLLRALPLLADAHQQLLQLGSAEAAGEADGAARELVHAARDLSYKVTRAAALLSPDQLAALGTALWQLHSAAVRAVFWGEAGSWRQLPCLQSGDHRNHLAPILADAIMAASLAHHQTQHEHSHSLPGSPLAAMCVAHWEVVQLLVASTTLEPHWGRMSMVLAHELCTLAADGPAALATDPRLQALLRDALDSSAEGEAEHLTTQLHPSIASLLAAPRLTAVLLTSRWLDRMVEDMAGTYSNERRGEVAKFAGWVIKGLRRLAEDAAAESNSASSSSSSSAGSSVSSASPLQQHVAALAAALGSAERPLEVRQRLKVLLRQALPPARQLAVALQERWASPEQAEADMLEMVQAAAARSCAYLRCANLGGEGGPAAGPGRGSKRCSKCRAVWYCGTDCSHADWRGSGGHRRTCGALEAARLGAKAEPT